MQLILRILRDQKKEYCIITGKYIVIYEVDESVSVLRVLDTRTDYVKVLLAE